MVRGARGHSPTLPLALALALTLTLALALALTLTLTLTRYELGGRGKYTTGLVFGSLWVLFITLSSIYLMHDIAIF